MRNLGLGMAEDENASAETAFREQRIDDAHAHWTRALEYLGEKPKVGRRLLARMHDGLALSAALLGRPDESREHERAAQKLYERSD